MTAGDDPPPPSPVDPIPPDFDSLHGFDTEAWFDPSDFISDPPETLEDRCRRLADDAAYRQLVKPTDWFRYAVLGRYAVNGFKFQRFWTTFSDNPATIYRIIWYNFMYHLDREVDTHPSLEAWAVNKAQPYLAVHDLAIFSVDTKRTSWVQLWEGKYRDAEWKVVGPKNRPSAKAQANPTKRMGMSQLNAPKGIKNSLSHCTPTILEEIEEDNHDDEIERVSPKPSQKKSVEGASVDSIGKQSAIIQTFNVPMNDGTH